MESKKLEVGSGPPLEPPSPTRFLRRGEASDYLCNKWGIKRAPATLAKLACVGGGPRFRKAGRWPLYNAPWLDEWVNELIGLPVGSTTDSVSNGAGFIESTTANAIAPVSGRESDTTPKPIPGLIRVLNADRAGWLWRACCPAHADQSQSLIIYQYNDGTVDFACSTGCTSEEIRNAAEKLELSRLDRPHSKTVRST